MLCTTQVCNRRSTPTTNPCQTCISSKSNPPASVNNAAVHAGLSVNNAVHLDIGRSVDESTHMAVDRGASHAQTQAWADHLHPGFSTGNILSASAPRHPITHLPPVARSHLAYHHHLMLTSRKLLVTSNTAMIQSAHCSTIRQSSTSLDTDWEDAGMLNDAAVHRVSDGCVGATSMWWLIFSTTALTLWQQRHGTSPCWAAS